jgi:hypothetical protein
VRYGLEFYIPEDDILHSHQLSFVPTETGPSVSTVLQLRYGGLFDEKTDSTAKRDHVPPVTCRATRQQTRPAARAPLSPVSCRRSSLRPYLLADHVMNPINHAIDCSPHNNARVFILFIYSNLFSHFRTSRRRCHHFTTGHTHKICLEGAWLYSNITQFDV